LCRADGLEAEEHATTDELLTRVDRSRNSCILLDLRLDGATGFDAQERLAEVGCKAPVIFLTGHGTIPLTVRAMRAGAWEFLTKPVKGPVLLESIRAALSKDADELSARRQRSELEDRLETLTPREREVLPLIISGLMNKQIAAILATSEITAKVHKRRVLAKMGASSLAELVRMAEELGVRPACTVETRISG
jgi:FixJ family two-component response regulator